MTEINFLFHIYKGLLPQSSIKMIWSIKNVPAACYDVLFNKRSQVNQVVRFGGRSMLKLNPERAVEIPETDNSCSEFYGGFMAQRPDFYLLLFGRYSWMKTVKIGKLRIIPQSASLFLVHKPNKKKLIVRKSFLCLPLLESKRIFFIQSLAEIWTISWGTHLERFPNHFIRHCRFVYSCLLLPPKGGALQSFCLFPLSVFFSFLYVSNQTTWVGDRLLNIQ